MKLTHNIFTTLFGRVFVLALSLVSSIILARALGAEGRGIFALTILLPELLTVFGLLGIEQSNAVYSGLEPEKRRELTWHSAVIALVVGCLLAIIGVGYFLAGAPGLSNSMKGPRWFYLLPLGLVPARILIQYWMAILRGMNRIILLNVIEVGFKAVSFVLMLVFVVILGTGVAGAVWVDSAVMFGAVVVLAVVLLTGGLLGRPTFDRALLKRSAGFALPSHFAGIMTYLNYRIDQFIIAVFLPPEALAVYVIAVDIAEKIWILPGAIGTALLPHLTNSPDRDPEVTAHVARHSVFWTAGACVFVFFISPFAIELLYSSEFANAVLPLRWLLPGIFTLAIAKVLVSELQARERIRFTVWLSLAAAIVNAVLNVYLLPHLGIAGAAIASTISYFLVAIVVLWYYIKETGLPWNVFMPRRSDLTVYTTKARALAVRVTGVRNES